MNNVAMLMPSLGDGGVEGVVKDYATKLDKQLYNCFVITVVKGNKDLSLAYKCLLENGIRVLSVYDKPLVFRFKLFERIWCHFFDNFYVSNKIKKILKREKVDILHCHMRVLRFVSPIRKSIKNVKLFYTCHGILETYLTVKEEYDAAKQLIKENGLKFIALHRDMANEINELFNIDNTEVLYNGVDYSKFTSVIKDKSVIRKELGIPLDAFVIGHVGRLAQEKNHSFILQVFSELYKRKSNAFLVLVIAGNGNVDLIESMLSFIEDNKLSDRVLILYNRSDVPCVLKAMDAFIFPSKHEGFGLAAVEAQMAGLKCVFSTAIPKDVVLTKNTFSLDLNQPISEWCDVLLNDKAENSEYGKLFDLDITHVIKKLIKIYES